MQKIHPELKEKSVEENVFGYQSVIETRPLGQTHGGQR
jgi:hypothetical protein